ncbi:hypothetical protein BV22DRAFT_1040983 [Leucogyrophana mollusca]|uniref:Uncharacterized protein n=1 Tax=Leucogyrophana mollusca TaxID=85980 RepID=A0ACB8B1R7_9AGAM|nr:hypothetical protein BV22DRAFT_1040983 [Leucogyrophana mollusca]
MTAGRWFYSVLTAFVGLAMMAFFVTQNRPIAEPNASVHLSFNVRTGDPVAMTVYDSTHYQLDDDGAADYAMLMPSGGHTVHIADSPGSSPKPYTVTLFHQLKCLEIIHREYLAAPSSFPPILSHCMNYLRQTIICRPNLRLESAQSAAASVDKEYETVCRDWTQVYAEAERNFGEYTTFNHIQV